MILGRENSSRKGADVHNRHHHTKRSGNNKDALHFGQVGFAPGTDELLVVMKFCLFVCEGFDGRDITDNVGKVSRHGA